MASNTQNRSKRPKPESSPEASSPDIEITQTVTHWPRFLVIEAIDKSKPVSSLSPFVIEKTLKGLIGETKSVKKLNSGIILVEVLREGQANNLLKQTSFASIDVQVSEHRTLNTCKGVIRCMELAQMESDELLANLSTHGVVAVRNITQKRDGVVRKTAAVVLTFATPDLPKDIKAGYLSLRVSPFVPNPLRCFNCQSFGHHQSLCKKAKLCPKCGLADHGDAECSTPVKCLNCSGDHPAYATSCPRWAQEKEICRVKTTNKISFPEARKLVVSSSSVSTARPSYASIVNTKTNISVGTKSTRTVETQTDCLCQCTCQAHAVSNEGVSNTTATQTENQKNKPSQTALNQTTQHSVSNKQIINPRSASRPNRGERVPSRSPKRPAPQSGACSPSADGPDFSVTGRSRSKTGSVGRNAPRTAIQYPT
jgi:hypothetical protein